MRQVRYIAFACLAAALLFANRAKLSASALDCDQYSNSTFCEDVDCCETDAYDAYDFTPDACGSSCDVDLEDTCNTYCNGYVDDGYCDWDYLEDYGGGLTICHGFYIDCRCIPEA